MDIKNKNNVVVAEATSEKNKVMATIVPSDTVKVMAKMVSSSPKKEMVKLIKQGEISIDKEFVPDVQDLDLGKPVINNMCHAANKDERKEIEIPQLLESKFLESPQGLYKSNDYIMNATVKIVEVYSMIENGKSCEKVRCMVNVWNKPSFDVVLNVKEFREGKWLLEYAAVVYKCNRTKAAEAVYEYLNELLEKQEIQVCSYKEHQGWTVYQSSHVYVTCDGIIGGSGELKAKKGTHWLPWQGFYYQKDNFERVCGVCHITKSSATATVMLLYLIQSTLYTLFDEAGVVPKYCIFVEGPRGSHKTSLSMAILKPDKRTVPEYTFKDTTAALETGFAKNADAVMIIDDLMPTEDSGMKKVLENNLEFVTRCFGDANGKNRNLDFMDRKGPQTQYKTHGGAVFTGEYVHSMCASSFARMLVLHIESDTVDIDNLSYYQEHPECLSNFLQSFIIYVGHHYEAYVKVIKDLVKHERRKLNGEFSNSRYAEYIAQLTAAATILGWYGVSIGCIQQEQLRNFVDGLMRSVYAAVRLNDVESRNEDPARRIALAITESISNGELIVVKPNQKVAFEHFVVDDDNFIHITEKDLVCSYRNYLQAHGYRNLDCKDSTLKTALVNADALQIQKEGNKKRYATKISGQGNKRFLHIHRERLYELSEM